MSIKLDKVLSIIFNKIIKKAPVQIYHYGKSVAKYGFPW